MLFIEDVICTKTTVVATVIITIACNITIVLLLCRRLQTTGTCWTAAK